MTRARIITIGGALLVGLVLAVLGYLLADSQAQDRSDVRKRFQDVATVSASVTNGIFEAALSGTTQQASARLGAPEVADADVEQLAARSELAYAGVLDARGRRLAATGAAPDEFGDAVDTALESSKPWLSNTIEMGSKRVVEWAIPYADETGAVRIYLQGVPAANFEEFLKAALGDLPGFGDPGTVMIDGNGVVMGGVKSSTAIGETIDDELLQAVRDGAHGEYDGGRYFASGQIANSPLLIVLDSTEEKLYDSIPGSRKTLPWIIFVAFALAALGGLFLLRRALASAAEIERRELNERHAVEINDNIIQGLALAKYQLQRGEGEASATQLTDTLREAQHLVSGLLGDAEIQAGQLRREAAAETRGPAPDPDPDTPSA